MQKRNLVIWGVIILMFMVMMTVTQNNSNSAANDEITYSDLVNRITDGKIKSITDKGDVLLVTDINGEEFKSVPPLYNDDLDNIAIDNGVEYQAERTSRGSSFFFAFLFQMLPFILLIGIWIFFMRNMQNNGKSAMGFGKSKAKLLNEQHGRRTFDDVAGVNEAKEELQEVVEFLKDPSKFQRLGGKIPRGALLVGPPGTGKTLLARAVAGEAGVPFFTISGSDFVEMFVGVGASRVRDMFEQAKKNAPCIIFIDEIDAVGRHRGVGTSGGHEEREQTLNQLLVEMDGFEGNEGVIIIAATNRPDVLDKALLRPGRFDRQVHVPLPDIEGREAILKVHMREVPLASDVDPRVIARGTPGFSGADLANLVNEAALMAARRNKRKVAHREFEDAKDKVMMGPERKSMVMTEDEKALTAYHEAGHAIVALNVPASDPIHKATIIPRGGALGMVVRLPERDQYSMSRDQMTSFIAIAMGGRVAEEVKFGHGAVTSGASQDIEMATRTARAMVTEYGLSDKIGPIAYKNTDQDSFHPGIGRGSSISAETARVIEDEIKRFVTEGYEEAKRILKTKKKDWEILAEGLLEYETLNGEEIKELLKGNPPKRPSVDEPSGKPPISAVPPTGKRKPRGGGISPEPQPGT